MSPYNHLFLYTFYFLLLLVLSLKGRIGLTKHQFWTVVITFGVLFVVIEGSRYGRGVDWWSYKYRFEHIDLKESQKGFLNYMLLLKSIGFNYVLYYMTNAALFLTGLLYFIRKNYNYHESQWMLLFAICALLGHFENEIRQYLAFPFLLFALSKVMNAKGKSDWILGGIITVVALSIHTGWLFCIPFLLISFLYVRKTLSPYLTIPLLFAAYYIIPHGLFANTFIEQMALLLRLSDLNDSEMVGIHYIEDSERWLGEDSILQAAMQTPLTKFLQFAFECGIIVASYIALKKEPNQKVLFLYNLFLVFAFLDRVLFGYEIFQRLTRQLYIFWFVPLGYALYVFSRIHGKHKEIMRYALYISITYQIFYWGRFVFCFPEAKFIWDV